MANRINTGTRIIFLNTSRKTELQFGLLVRHFSTFSSEGTIGGYSGGDSVEILMDDGTAIDMRLNSDIMKDTSHNRIKLTEKLNRIMTSRTARAKL